MEWNVVDVNIIKNIIVRISVGGSQREKPAATVSIWSGAHFCLEQSVKILVVILLLFDSLRIEVSGG